MSAAGTLQCSGDGKRGMGWEGGGVGSDESLSLAGGQEAIPWFTKPPQPSLPGTPSRPNPAGLLLLGGHTDELCALPVLMASLIPPSTLHFPFLPSHSLGVAPGDWISRAIASPPSPLSRSLGVGESASPEKCSRSPSATNRRPGPPRLQCPLGGLRVFIARVPEGGEPKWARGVDVI